MDEEPRTAALIDSRLLGDAFGSRSMRALFSDVAVLQSWLDTEAALARVQARLGIIPQEAATEIEQQARSERFDLAFLGREAERMSHPLVAVVRELERACRGDLGQYVHYGATTQDITDTGLVLQLKAGLTMIKQELAELLGELVRLAVKYRDLPMVGRTHGQHALPITLGLKFAVVAAELNRHSERIAQMEPRVLVGQLGGAVGSLAAFGPNALELQSEFMSELGLGTTSIPWHSARDGFAEAVSVLSMIAATVGKLANEIRVLQRTEVAELEEPFVLGKVGSSTMPHKKNPMVAENVVASVLLCRQGLASMLAAMHQEHERDMSSWGVEWSVLPQTFCLVAGTLEKAIWMLQGLRVQVGAVRRNLHLLGGLMLSEAVMMHVASSVGKQRAHEVIYEAAMQGWENDRSFEEILLDSQELRDGGLEREELQRLLEPERYLGMCGELIDRVVAEIGSIDIPTDPRDLIDPERAATETEEMRSS